MLQPIKDPCRTKKIPETNYHILIGKGPLLNRKSTSQKKVNNKNHTTCSDLYHKAFLNFD